MKCLRSSILDPRSSLFIILLLVVFFPFMVQAKIAKEIKESVQAAYTPSLPQDGLITAQAGLERDKLRTFIVVEKGNVIPAERAFYLITPQNYEYRGAVVKGETVKTRHGKPYIYLPRGTTMAVAEDIFSGKTIYLKLISLKKMKSPTKPKKKPTRVTVMLGFRFDKATLEGGDATAVLAKMREWVKPFQTFEEAMKYSESIFLPPPPEPKPAPQPEMIPDE